MSLTHAPTTVDQHGNPIQGDAEAIARFDQAVDALLRFHPSVIDHATALGEHHPDLAIGSTRYVAFLRLSRPSSAT